MREIHDERDELPPPQESDFDMDEFVNQPVPDPGPSGGSVTITGELLVGAGDLEPCEEEYITRREVHAFENIARWEFLKGMLVGIATASLACFVGVVFIVTHNPWG